MFETVSRTWSYVTSLSYLSKINTYQLLKFVFQLTQQILYLTKVQHLSINLFLGIFLLRSIAIRDFPCRKTAKTDISKIYIPCRRYCFRFWVNSSVSFCIFLLLTIYITLCVCAYMYVYIIYYMFILVCAQVETRGQCWVSPLLLLILWLGQLVNDFRIMPIFLPTSTGVTDGYCCSWLLHGCLGFGFKSSWLCRRNFMYWVITSWAPYKTLSLSRFRTHWIF